MYSCYIASSSVRAIPAEAPKIAVRHDHMLHNTCPMSNVYIAHCKLCFLATQPSVSALLTTLGPMQALAPCHGLASGLLHHSETVLFGSNSEGMHSMVYALFPEFLSHRTHFATAQALAQPGFFTRLLLVSTQVRIVQINFHCLT